MADSGVPSQAIQAEKSPKSVRYLDTITAYDLWSEVYDTDGNFLQALDTVEMRTLLPDLIRSISTPRPWKIVDIGCGTGRNTMSLLPIAGATVIGVDASRKMLEVAKTRARTTLLSLPAPKKAAEVHFDLFDLLHDHSAPATASGADAAISTLVLEHIPIHVFFAAATNILQPGGLLLVTNMHSAMGAVSQAGFVDPKTGNKIRPTSYSHQVEDVVDGARRCGLDLVGNVQERAVDEHLAEALGPRAKKWIGVTVWFSMRFRKVG